MTIKKPMKVQAAAAAAPVPGGAAIADRLRLDIPDSNANAGMTKATKIATIAGFVALVVLGVLAVLLYTHWDSLKDF